MKYLNLILAAVLASIVAAQAAQKVAFTQREVRDPRQLEAALEANAADAQAQLAAVEAAGVGSALASGKIIVGNSGGTGTAVTVTGDIAISNTGAASIGSGVIVNADIATNAAIAGSKLAQAVQDSLSLADSAVQPIDADYTNAVALAGSAVQSETDPVVSAIVGIVMSDGTNLSAAVAGADYQSPITVGTDYLAPDGNLTGSMGTSTTAVATVVSGAALGTTSLQPNAVAVTNVIVGVGDITNTIVVIGGQVISWTVEP